MRMTRYISYHDDNREDLRRWFLKQESDLFRFRLERLDPQ